MRHVIVFSEDGQALEGLRRSLRVFQNAWATHFVETAGAALQVLMEHPAEALICDSRVAGVEAFRSEARDRWPAVVRAVMCGADVAAEQAQRLTRLSHQVLKKPLIPGQLFDLVERTALVLATVRSERVKVVLSRLGALPALPTTYARLSELTANPNASLDEVASVLEQDPAITANVLRIINSAYFGLPRRVSSVRETVKLLGIQPLKNIVLTVELYEGPAAGKSAKALQLDALARACAMRELLGRTPMAEAAFAAGILADVGRLLIATRLPLDMQAMTSDASGRAREVIERERLGSTHAELGGALLSLWNMPTSLVEAVTLHHSPPDAAATANVPTALALVCAIEEELSTSDTRRSAELTATIDKLAQLFPTVTLQAVRRQLAPREVAVA
ncbi:MAG: HDOD domain-containing protein [Myxococcaceae bacterium]|nr:HDOD domain-containing protein [Myxococcaceae bacterium]